MTSVFYNPPNPLWWGGGEPTLKILCDISILGFSMVGISKVISVFLYKPPNPLGGEGEDPQLKYYVIFYKGGNFKNDIKSGGT